MFQPIRDSFKWQAVVLVCAVLSLSGCAVLWPSYDARLTGSVTNATGGSPVVGTRVTISAMDGNFRATAQTGALGQFSIPVPAGRYELKLSKPGWATSHVIGVVASGATHVDVIQREAFNPNWSLRPPRIALQGVSEGGRYQGAISYRVDVEADNGMDALYAAIGKTPGSSFMTAPRQFFSQTNSSGDQTIDPQDYGVHGPTTFEVVAYDKNGNRTHLIQRITILPQAGPIFPPSGLRAMAVTLGEQILFNGGGGGRTEAAPGGANLYVELSWDPSPNSDIDGYRLYRSTNGLTYSLAGTTGSEQTAFRDANPAMAIGAPLSYRVAAFRGGDEGAWSQAATTTPLPAWDVFLVAPRDEAIGVPTAPTFRWTPTREVGAQRFYAVLLWDTVLGNSTFWITPDPPDYTQDVVWTWNQDGRYTGTPWETLQAGRVYEWEVAYAVAVDDPNDPHAVSVAANRFGLGDPNIPVAPFPFDTTDNFSFTTGN